MIAHPRADTGYDTLLNRELSQVDLQVQAGDSFLLCSDGLNKTAEDHELRDVLCHTDPHDVVRSLIHLGLTRGAPDNITAIVVKAAGH